MLGVCSSKRSRKKACQHSNSRHRPLTVRDYRITSPPKNNSRKVNFSFSLPPQQQHQLSTTDSITQKTCAFSSFSSLTSSPMAIGSVLIMSFMSAHEQQDVQWLIKLLRQIIMKSRTMITKIDKKQTENELERLLVSNKIS